MRERFVDGEAREVIAKQDQSDFILRERRKACHSELTGLIYRASSSLRRT